MSNMRRFCEFTFMLILFVVVMFSIKPADAITIETYTDRAAWESAISSINQEDFNSFTDFCSIPSFPNHENVGVSLKLQELGNNPWSKNIISPKTDYSIDIDGSSYIFGRVEKESIEGTEHKTRLNMMFDEPIAAWGADFRDVKSEAGIDILLTENDNSDDGELLSGESMNNDGFFGFIIQETPKDFSRVVLQARGKLMGATALLSEGFGMDNVVFVKAKDFPYNGPNTSNSIPEPNTIFLFGSLLILLGVFKKKF